jgi:hypothetical protein
MKISMKLSKQRLQAWLATDLKIEGGSITLNEDGVRTAINRLLVANGLRKRGSLSLFLHEQGDGYVATVDQLSQDADGAFDKTCQTIASAFGASN